MRKLMQFAVLMTAAPVFAQTQPHRISSPMAVFEDADITAPGALSISQDFTYTRTYAGRDLSAPALSCELGLHPRIDVSVSSGYAASHFENFRASGLSDTYAGAKFLLVKEGRRRPALAVKPTLEVLGAPSIANNLLAPGRVNFLLPVAIQKTWTDTRVYYTGGYLTRGLQFHSLAYELDRWAHVTPTLIVSHSRLTRELDLVSELGLNRSRSDALGLVSVNPSPWWGFYASAGRTFGRTDGNSLRFQFTGGLSFNLHLWARGR